MKHPIDLFPTHQLLADELAKRNFSVSIKLEGKRQIATYASASGAAWVTRVPRIRYPFTDGDEWDLFDDKADAYEFVQAKGVPVPFTHHMRLEDNIDMESTGQLIDKYAPLVVKPNDSSSSKGLTLNITTSHQLQNALNVARAVKKSNILVQQQVSGDELRFIVVKGEIIAAFLRQTPRVIGDGKSSVADLIKRENKQREQLVFPYISYPQLTAAIIDPAFFGDERVLAEGEVLELSRATMIREGCSVYEVLNQVHPSYLQEIKRLVKDFKTPFFVADFLIADFTSEARYNNYWFLEFNASPALKLFYGSRDGEMFNVVPLVADLIEEAINKA